MRALGWICLYLAFAFFGAAGLQSLQAKTLTLLPIHDVATAFGGSLGSADFIGGVPIVLPFLMLGALCVAASTRNKRPRIFGPRRRRY
jgi:hypothetical protein